MDLAAYSSELAARLDADGGGVAVVEGTVCFVDVSGFTRLNERLGQTGPEGTEVVKQAVSAVFDGLITAAAAHGGDVLTFAGDAVSVLFTGDDHARRGAAAAAGMQRFVRAMPAVPTPLGPVRLQMSAGVESGTDAHLLVGTHRRAMLDMGPATTGAARCEAAARSGEVLVGPRLAAALPPAWSRQGSAPGVHRLDLRRAVLDPVAPLAPAPGATGRSFVPEELREDVEAGLDTAEHRAVSVAFVVADAPSVGPSAPVPGDGFGDLVRTARLVEDACREHGVTWLECDSVPGAVRWILVAGAPAADEDDDRRLLQAVADVLDGAGGVGARAGVQRGRVFVADVGNERRRTYNLMGDAMNVAARLSALAGPGSAVVSVDALPGGPATLPTAEVEVLALKGRAAGLPAVRCGADALRAAAAARPAAARVTAGLVGRATEVAAVAAAVGAGRSVAVVADAGTGKSRLAAEAELRGGPWVWVRGDSVRRHVPFGAVRPWVRDLLDLEHRTLAQAVPVEHHGWLPLLADLTGDEVPPTAQVDLLDPRFRRDRTVALLDEVGLWDRAAGTVVGVEDLHWFDEASVDVVASFLRHGAGSGQAAVVLTRPADGLDAVLDVVDDVVELRSLDRAAARSLVLEVVGEAPMSDAALDTLLDQADGNPLFLVELAREWVQGGGAVPGSVEQVLAARLDRLPRRARDVVRRLSVLGSRSPRWLVDVLVGPQELAEASSAGADGFVLVDDDGAQFAHDLVRDAAYGALPVSRRRAMHRQLAETLTARPGARSFDVARHWDLAGDASQTWQWARRAAADATAAGAVADAAVFLRAAVRAARSLDDVEATDLAASMEQLADLDDRLGNFDGALDALSSARRLTPDDARQAELLSKVSRVKERAGNYRGAMVAATAAVRHAEAAGRPDLVAWALLMRTAVRFYQGRYTEALAAGRQALAIAEAQDDRRLLAQAHLQVEMQCSVLGLPERDVHEERAMALLEELDDPVGLGNLLLNMSVGEIYRSEWHRAAASCDHSASSYRRGGDVVGAALANNNLAELFTWQFRLDDADVLFSEVRRQCGAAGYGHGIHIAESGLARVAAWRGDIEEARTLLARAMFGFSEQGMQDLVADTSLREAELLLLSSDAPAALEQVVKAQALMSEVPDTELLPCVLARLEGCALFALGRMSDAARAFAVADAAARTLGFDYEVALADLCLAACGDEPEVRRARANEVFDRLGVLAPPPSVPVAAETQPGAR